ncbi:unnamed protein product [Meganyctiphanes norvegica]|uniref:Uncharacterized protein n=1 Tax=Meganyctiphanes norvegica TaxID=48144 RepID=A0AAV2S4D2_MEGNR
MNEDRDGTSGSMASQTPTSLRQLSAISLASAVVHQCQPKNWSDSYSILLPPRASVTAIAEFLDIDSIIMSKQQIINREYFLRNNQKLTIVLKAVLSWWNGVNGLDSLPGLLQREVRQAITKVSIRISIEENIE